MGVGYSPWGRKESDKPERLNSKNTTYGASQVALVVKNPAASAEDTRDMGLIPESGRSPQVGNGNSL